MAKAKTSTTNLSGIKIRPALSPEAEENQCISLAVDLAKKQLIEGTASSQVITHYLKLGTARERLEREKLAAENKLLLAKADAVESMKKMDQIYLEAIAAMKRYSGHGEESEPDDDRY